MKILLYVPVMAVVLQDAKCAIPGNFFWSPRMSMSFRADDQPETKFKVHYPSVHNIQENKVILINGYQLGTSMVAIATVGSLGRPKFPQMDMRSADFYTNAYRWVLRAISLVPDWLGGADAKYPDTHKIWRKRFFYMEDQVPQWLRSILWYVDDWDREDWAKKRYKLYAEPSFDKHLRFPSKRVHPTIDFESFRHTKETVENLDDSEAETVAPRSMEWGPKVNNLYNDIWGRMGWGQ